MAFWLARERRGQDSDYIQRFDPRFWTVNFPRPAMAAVTTIGTDGLKVDCDFYHKGELVGLIWESEDTLDHPLLAYATSRDYANTVLKFHWSSNKLAALDAVDGPTLTIEGRDAAGTPRSWYVRLWNYATGTPEDADIELPFSALESGWSLPGEAVHPADIDRMFISLVPESYEQGSEEPFNSRVSAWVKLTGISCDGRGAMLEIGDVIIPPHEERIATAYDDSYNMVPERLVRMIRGLGYRQEIVHYVGMSHFPRLAWVEDGEVRAQAGDTICRPAMVWHRGFFRECKAAGYEVIASISYELLADYCPDAWQQRAFDGEPGRTGWSPPSALLSPGNVEAMAWLRDAAQDFCLTLQRENLPVRVQIGEPWWWVMPDGRPCLYDAASLALFGQNAPEIADVGGSLDAGQIDLLDRAGELLGQSTIDLARAVRDFASGDAEVLLLAFTPTILDAERPELYRANMPLAWAWPAFDRLQLEDYDWLTAGAEALRRSAYTLVGERLGYPIDRQDYFAGFVLDEGDAEALWPLIDAGLDEAAARGVTRRFVWALPQVARDGYVRLPTIKDDAMLAFDDVLYPLALGRDTMVSPEFSTSVSLTASGHERRNSLWSDARLHFDVGPGIRSEQELGVLLSFFRARRGAARAFRIADPFDFSTNAMTGTPTPTDQTIGTGDGLTVTFQLAKSYGEGAEPQLRPIGRPRAETLRVAVDGAETQDWSLSGGGKLTLGSAPKAGASVTAGFLFDVAVRFAEDRIDVSGVDFAAGEAPSIPLVEVREEL